MNSSRRLSESSIVGPAHSVEIPHPRFSGEHRADSHKAENPLNRPPQRIPAMSVGYYLRLATMNAQQYEALIERLEASGNGSPEGRLHHSCFGSDDALRVW